MKKEYEAFLVSACVDEPSQAHGVEGPIADRRQIALPLRAGR